MPNKGRLGLRNMLERAGMCWSLLGHAGMCWDVLGHAGICLGVLDCVR